LVVALQEEGTFLSCVLGLKPSECSSTECSYIGVVVSDDVVDKNIRLGAFDGFLFEFCIGIDV